MFSEDRGSFPGASSTSSGVHPALYLPISLQQHKAQGCDNATWISGGVHPAFLLPKQEECWVLCEVSGV